MVTEVAGPVSRPAAALRLQDEPACSDTAPRTAALGWFAAAFLLVLGMSFLILPMGPINPLHGFIWLRGPFFCLSGLVMLWACALHMSGRAATTAHLLAAVPPLAVGVDYLFLGQYSPAITLLLLGAALVWAPFAPRRSPTSAPRPDLLGIVLGLSLAAAGAILIAQSGPPVVPYGLQGVIATLFLVFGLAVVGCHLVPRVPLPLSAVAHIGGGAALIAQCVIFAVGVDPILWVLNASTLLLAFAIITLPWLSARLVAPGRRLGAGTCRAALLFTGSLVPLLIAVPAALSIGGSTDPSAASTRQAAFGLTLLLALVAAFAGWWLARYLVVPLSRLVAGVDKIAAGARPVDLSASGPRELEELAAAVEAMAAELDEQMRELRSARDQHKTVADKLQRALQVSVGDFPGIELAHVYHSASNVGEVGGDFYDVFPVPPDSIGIVVGDVAGKGLDAAAQAVLMRTSIRAFTQYTGSPAEILARANELLLHSRAGGFVTAVVGILDPASGALLCSSAGHPPPILLGPSGATLLEEHGPLLGVMEEARFTETALCLQAGEGLLLYTDGVTDARRRGDIFGEARLMAAVSSLAGLEPPDLARALYERVLEFSGGDIGDDLALVALRLLPAAQRTAVPQSVAVDR